MKRTFFAVTFFLLIQSFAIAQSEFLERQKEKAKNKVSNRVENKIDEGMDKALDKTEEGIEESVKRDGKKEKKEKNGKESNDAEDTMPSSENSSETPENEGSNGKIGVTTTDLTFKSYSKFDFVSGENVVVYDDFSSTSVGDFPINWNTNASGEVVEVENADTRFFRLATEGIYHPDDLSELPENVTIEFDLYAENFSEMQSGLKLYIVKKQEQPMLFDQWFSTDAQVGFDIHPYGEKNGVCHAWSFDNNGNKVLENQLDLHEDVSKIMHISIWRQKNRVRLYINETKVWDLPKALATGNVYDLIFATNMWEGAAYISNLRVAEGAPDTRSKLITEGKLTSRGIFFDTNSDRIKPESYGALKEIAKVLEVHPEVNVQIVGHTDSDGDEASNLELSKRRAAAVKKILSSEFGIAEGRLSTDGKGEAQPTDPNTTPVGKANNRRVEFIKQ